MQQNIQPFGIAAGPAFIIGFPVRKDTNYEDPSQDFDGGA
jgi:hypothetical protein